MAKGYGDVLALVEIGKQIGMQMAKAEEKKPEKTKPEKKEKPPSWEQLWLEEQQRRAKFDDFMKVLKKQLAEDPKKEDDKKKIPWTVDNIALLLLAIVPLNWAAMYLLLH